MQLNLWFICKVEHSKNCAVVTLEFAQNGKLMKIAEWDKRLLCGIRIGQRNIAKISNAKRQKLYTHTSFLFSNASRLASLRLELWNVNDTVRPFLFSCKNKSTISRLSAFLVGTACEVSKKKKYPRVSSTVLCMDYGEVTTSIRNPWSGFPTGSRSEEVQTK